MASVCTFAGVAGSLAVGSSDGTYLTAVLRAPAGIVIDPATGDVLVADRVDLASSLRVSRKAGAL